ncbi:MAG: hypothetical protein VYD55_04590 [Chloroflexota bacterium]|nr:hypothetical protein [Chloroflexota bacterium]
MPGRSAVPFHEPTGIDNRVMQMGFGEYLGGFLQCKLTALNVKVNVKSLTLLKKR